MSAQNNRKFLVGFGALAVVLIVVVAIWRPQFPSDNASGAIGAVQKHHAPQINKADVVLGDEKTSRDQKILFGDSFADATRLQNVAIELGSISEAELVAGSSARLQAAKTELREMSAEMQSRYVSGMTAALASMEQMLVNQKSNQLGNLREEAAELAAAMRNQHQLSSAEMEQLAAKVASFNQEMQSHQVGSSSLAATGRDLGTAVAEMQSNASLASSKLENVALELNAQTNLGSLSLANYAESLASMAAESKSLNEIEMQLASKAANIASMESAVKELAGASAKLESRGLENIEQQMASATEMASALHDMEMQLASAQQAGSKVGMTSQLGSVQQALESRAAEFKNRIAGNVSAELASFQSYLGARAEIAARLGSGSQLQANVMESRKLGARMDAKAELAASLASVASLQSRLASIEKSLERQSVLGSMLANQQQLSAQAHALENTAAALEARQH